MIPEERREKIIEKLKESNFCRLDDLKNDLEVSRVTVQRDVNQLEKDGLVDKVHGGVKLKKEKGGLFETRFSKRLNSNYYKKVDIAKKAVNFVNDSSTIFIDASTTCHIFAKELFQKPFLDLNLITNSPNLVCELPDTSNIRIISTGGLYRRDFNMYYGHWVVQILNKINIDIAFVSAAGVSFENGITSSDVELTVILKTIFKRSNEVYLLADSSKFSKSGLLKISEIGECKKIITNSDVSPKIIKDFKNRKKPELIY